MYSTERPRNQEEPGRACQYFVKQSVRSLVEVSTTGGVLDILPTWVVTIAAVAVGVIPGLAILSTGSIARLLHRALSPRPAVASRPGPDRTLQELAGSRG